MAITTADRAELAFARREFQAAEAAWKLRGSDRIAGAPLQ